MADKREKPAFLENTPKGTKMFYVRCSMSGYSYPSIEEVTYEGYKTELKRQTYDEYYPTALHCVWDQAFYNIKFKTNGGKIIKVTCDSNSNLCSADTRDHWDGNEHYDRKNDVYFTTDQELLKKYIEDSKLVEYTDKRIEELKDQIHKLEEFKKGITLECLIMEIKEGHILDFDHDYKPAHYLPKEDGYYMTIRCGLGGIYYELDEWKDGHWQVCVLDGSKVIAYSKEQITKEAVNEWARNKLSKK